MKNYKPHRIHGSKMGRPSNLERIRALEVANEALSRRLETVKDERDALEAEKLRGEDLQGAGP